MLPACALWAQAASQNPDELGVVQCGQPFHREIEALDGYSNRSALGKALKDSGVHALTGCIATWLVKWWRAAHVPYSWHASPRCRCSGGGDAGIPLPTIVLDSEDRPLQYNEEEWEQGWVSQGGEQVRRLLWRQTLR